MSDFENAPSSLTSTGQMLRAAMPFSLVRRGRQVVGCWFTTHPRFETIENRGAKEQILGSWCHGMIKTEDGRVAGVNELLLGPDDMGEQALRLLFDAAGERTPTMRLLAASRFTKSVREGNGLFDVAWTPDRAGWETASARMMDGYQGWRWDGNEAALLHAVRAFFVSRQRVLRRFVDTLDEKLVGALRPFGPLVEGTLDMNGLVGEAWPLLDETFGRGCDMRDRILPWIEDHDRLWQLLGRHAAWASQHEDGGDEPDDDSTVDEMSVLRMRRFLPREPVDIENVPVPPQGR